MAGYDDYQTEEEYIAASKRRVTMADTKELVERLRKIADASRRADGTDIPLGQELRAANDVIQRLERERDEATANARMYEATAEEAARGLECLSDIDDAWDAIGTRGNRKALTLAEQISSLAIEMDDAESELTTLRARVARLEEALKAFGFGGDADQERIGWRGVYPVPSTNAHLRCEFCMEEHEDLGKIQHQETCPISIARAALTEEQP